MKTTASRNQSCRGILLIECLVYMGALFVVLGVAYSVCFGFWDNTIRLRHNADDIAAALRTGERWRDDVRAASAPLRIENSPYGTLLHVPQKTREVVYLFDSGSIWRWSDETPWVSLLANVKTSDMREDKRRQVTAWRWEIELKARRKSVRLRPLFTFEAVPNSMVKP
ncbi:MAG TPA: hypothetical protein VH598_04020 [Verrucomicrobiae bacterium]|nr:hypothetical protein [Verrucomicrobiae bacterium]